MGSWYSLLNSNITREETTLTRIANTHRVWLTEYHCQVPGSDVAHTWRELLRQMPHSIEMLIDAGSNNSDDVCIPIIYTTELFGIEEPVCANTVP